MPEKVRKSLLSALINNNPDLERSMTKIKDQVYSEFEILDRKEFEKVANHLSKSDNKIKMLIQEINENFIISCSGIKLLMTISFPDYVTAETTLYIYI